MIEDNNTNNENFLNAINVLNEYEYLNDGKEDQILSIFTLNQKRPCINPLEKSWDYHYILEKESEKCETEINLQQFDNRYEILSKYTTKKYELYSENSILDKLIYIDNISLNKLKKEEVYLFGRALTGLDKDIIDKFDYNLIIKKENLSNKCNKIMLYCILGIVLYWVLGFLIFIIVYFRIKKIGILSKIDCECDELTEEKYSCLKNVIIILGLILTGIAFLILSILIFIIFNSYKSIENKVNIKQSDYFLSKIINTEFEKYKGNYIFSLIFIILFSLQLIVFFISPCCCRE